MKHGSRSRELGAKAGSQAWGVKYRELGSGCAMAHDLWSYDSCMVSMESQRPTVSNGNLPERQTKVRGQRVKVREDIEKGL